MVTDLRSCACVLGLEYVVLDYRSWVLCSGFLVTVPVSVAITKCDQILLKSLAGITKSDRKLLQSATGITKCDKSKSET